MNSEYNKALNLIKSIDNGKLSFEGIKLNTNPLDVNRIINIYKIRKRAAEDKNNFRLVKDFSELISNLEIASKKHDQLRIISYETNALGYVLYVSQEIDKILAEFKGEIDENFKKENY